MDQRIQIWNVLHDGEITAIEGEDSHALTLFVSIPYLRRRLPPLGDSFVLMLEGLKRVDFFNFDGSAMPLREEIDLGTPEILQTSSDSMPITVETSMGKLVLDFEKIRFALDTGQPIAYETIENVCEQYWAERKLKVEQGRGLGG